jgi:hypothetical protein
MNCVCHLCNRPYVWRQSGGMSKRFCATCLIGIKRIRLKRRAVAYLGGVCHKCKQAVPLPAFDFHHRDPADKTAEPARLFTSAGWPRVKAEVDKCDLLCANCHRELEATQFRLITTTLDPEDPVWDGVPERQTRECMTCGAPVTRAPSNFKNRKVFCTTSCSNKRPPGGVE